MKELKEFLQVEKELNSNGIVLLDFMEYYTKDEEFTGTEKTMKYFDVLLCMVSDKIDKDWNVNFIRDTNVTLAWFEKHNDNEWYVVFRNYETNKSDVEVKIKELLQNKKYLKELKELNKLEEGQTMSKKEFKKKLISILDGKDIKKFQVSTKTVVIGFKNQEKYNDFKEFIMKNYYSLSEGLVVSGSYYDNRQTIILDYK